ncbi:hypothetical protein [Propionivibrio dicarboxylicus]|uniref:Uncharacterized protein n=1 Tax=Propionivibrio dicarboxylicus TaxID=83767 RepID=A0A1G8ILF9_9RHOO|nr:hypothetical protein [Propionivibrio dicarboxylicus]SDI19868.1 hypothetical protein SAMN05660652_03031 [Propionivibrio dicarboxylicus]
MRCPYCISDIHDDALVCPICRRDLYLFKPLLSRIDALEKQLTAHEERLSQLDALQTAPSLDTALVAPSSTVEPQGFDATPSSQNWLLNWITPLVLLIAAHGLIVILYDLNTVYLRVVSLVIPLPFGALLFARRRYPALLAVVSSCLLASAAVLAMSSLTAWVDRVPVLPQDLREWREFITYAASIALSYLTGMILGQMLRRRRQEETLRSLGVALALARVLSQGADKTERVEAVARKFHNLGSSLTAAATTAAAIFTGLQGLLGK